MGAYGKDMSMNSWTRKMKQAFNEGCHAGEDGQPARATETDTAHEAGARIKGYEVGAEMRRQEAEWTRHKRGQQ
jgi:hypothetical protein